MPAEPTEHPPDDAWNAWRPMELASRLQSVAAPWYVVGGWALDLWHGVETRAHEDLEFAILPQDLDVFREALGSLTFFTAHDGSLEYLPRDAQPASHISQLWGLDAPAHCWRVDMMLERGSAKTWHYKRHPNITAPRCEIVRWSVDGIPYLAPPAVLLFKAKHRRPKDETDFARALPRLGAADKGMLADWLDVAHPGHAWRQAL